MAIDFVELFSVTPSSDPSVTLVRTPLEYPGTNDNVVIRVRKTAEGLLADDGGDTEWFATTAGGNWNSVSVKNAADLCRLAFGVEMQKEGKLMLRPIEEADRQGGYAGRTDGGFGIFRSHGETNVEGQ